MAKAPAEPAGRAADPADGVAPARHRQPRSSGARRAATCEQSANIA